MRQLTMPLALAMACLAVAGGCQDYYAQKLLTQDTGRGKLGLALTGGGQRSLLLAQRYDQQLTIPGADKTPINAWVVRSKAPGQPKGTVILLHGLNESKAAFPYPGTAAILARMGYTAVLVDLRAHGCSGGQYITFGAKEKIDLHVVMDELARNKVVSTPFYAFGANLGGAVAIQYAAIDPRVRGVMAMAPYKDFRSIACWQMAFRAPMEPVDRVRQAVMHAAEMGKFDLADASAVKAVKRLDCPLLLVHGILDISGVPLEQTQAIYDAATCRKELLLVTPGPEQAALALVLEDWLAGQIDRLAAGKLATTLPAR